MEKSISCIFAFAILSLNFPSSYSSGKKNNNKEERQRRRQHQSNVIMSLKHNLDDENKDSKKKQKIISHPIEMEQAKPFITHLKEICDAEGLQLPTMEFDQMATIFRGKCQFLGKTFVSENFWSKKSAAKVRAM